jgi:hypothetical protein
VKGLAQSVSCLTAEISGALLTYGWNEDHSTSGVQAYLFSGAEGNRLVAWSVDELLQKIRMESTLIMIAMLR